MEVSYSEFVSLVLMDNFILRLSVSVFASRLSVPDISISLVSLFFCLFSVIQFLNFCFTFTHLIIKLLMRMCIII